MQRFYQPGPGNDFMWDELAAAAWIDPTLITKKESRYMSVDVDKGAGYGNTLTASVQKASPVHRQPVEIQLDLNKEKFYEMFAHLLQMPAAPGH